MKAISFEIENETHRVLKYTAAKQEIPFKKYLADILKERATKIQVNEQLDKIL